MSRKHPPRLATSSLTNRIYIITRYKDLGDGRFEALEIYDVTTDVARLLGLTEERLRQALREEEAS